MFRARAHKSQSMSAAETKWTNQKPGKWNEPPVDMAAHLIFPCAKYFTDSCINKGQHASYHGKRNKYLFLPNCSCFVQVSIFIYFLIKTIKPFKINLYFRLNSVRYIRDCSSIVTVYAASQSRLS